MALLKRAEIGFIALVAAYVAICWGITLATGFGVHFTPLMYLGTGLQITGTFLLGYILYRLARVLWILSLSLRAKRSNPESAWIAASALRPPRNDGSIYHIIFEDLKRGPLRPELYTRALPVFIGFVFFFSTFTSMKVLIAPIQPFVWDEFFMRADRLIHFGIDPWRILQPLFGYPWMTKMIAFIYVLWLPMFFMVLWRQCRDQCQSYFIFL